MSTNKEDLKQDLEGHKDQTQDAVFGEITEEGPNYRSVRYAPFLLDDRLT